MRRGIGCYWVRKPISDVDIWSFISGMGYFFFAMSSSILEIVWMTKVSLNPHPKSVS